MNFLLSDSNNYITNPMRNKRKQFFALAALSILSAAGGSAVAQEAAAQKPKAYLVSDDHLDTQWNWDIQTTIKEYVWNTINQNLFLLEKYPNYVFNFEGGVKYAWMKEYYPREYERMKQYIKQGRWHVCGTSWDATDVLVPSVESAIRNIMLGQEYYRKEFGVESTDIFLPDCFGFGWTLPTIASHCGLIGFSSQKLGWRSRPFYEGGKRAPFNLGLWKGVDGSAIMMAHGFNYTHKFDPEDLTKNKRLERLAKENPLNAVYHYYGTGDIGGAPNLNSVATVEKSLKNQGPVEIISATSDQVYKDFLPFEKHPEMPVFDGELLMDVHGTGCYTSQAAMKFYNRQNELLGDAAERASVTAEIMGLAPYPSASLTESWKRFIFHQFHDDLTGTSIPRAYEFSWNDELLSLKQFSGILTNAVGAVAEQLDTRAKGTPVVMFNALGTEATDLVEVAIPAEKYPGSVSVYNPEGKRVAAQILGYAEGKARILVEATVPANGFAVYDFRLSGKGKAAKAAQAVQTLENSVYKMELNAAGDITSILDKRNNKQLVKDGKAVRLALFTENESFAWPAWEIMKTVVDKTPISITDDVRMTLVEDGALRKTLCVEKKHGESSFRQYIHLYEGALAERIDFANEVNWQTLNALLKAEFPLNLDNEMATYDLGVGTVKRGNNTDIAYEVYAQQWADLSDKSGSYGVTLMNNCKYGWDKPDNNTLRLTLLHTPKTRGGYAYQDHQDLGYHTFTYSLVGHTGAVQHEEACRRAEGLNQRIKAFSTPEHKGALGKSFSQAQSSNPNVAIKALKKAESTDEYVVRVYETGGKTEQKATVTFGADILAAVEADGTEKTKGQATFSGRELQVAVGKNSIKTYKVKLAKKTMQQKPYQPMQLAFDKKCYTWNQFPGDADFCGGYSYAAELIPAELTTGGVPFRLENEELLNGMKCEGDTLSLPAGHSYNKLYVLAAAATDEKSLTATFRTGANVQEVKVPSYTGFIGQWGHTDHTVGYMTPAEVAYVGTHRHSAEGDQAYEFTYMFKYAIDIPEKATEIILPNNPDVVLFAATLAREDFAKSEALSTLFGTNNLGDRHEAYDPAQAKPGLLKPEHVAASSGYINEREAPAYLVDGKDNTKWCHTTGAPYYVEFDLGAQKQIASWSLLGAGAESAEYVTSGCLVQVRNSKDEDWKTVSILSGNKKNQVKRTLARPASARFVRLYVTQPEQGTDGKGHARIYEFNVYE